VYFTYNKVGIKIEYSIFQPGMWLQKIDIWSGSPKIIECGFRIWVKSQWFNSFKSQPKPWRFALLIYCHFCFNVEKSRADYLPNQFFPCGSGSDWMRIRCRYGGTSLLKTILERVGKSPVFFLIQPSGFYRIFLCYIAVLM